MAGLNIRFSDDELDALRQRAEAEGTSVQQFVRNAVITAISERARIFNEAADHVLRASEELNRRLA
ncbi:antitoxin Phd [Nocardia sp. NPDC050697]|uniref:plasmid mobilization protein n=1 Tax=Nocardia sp. NPDC050697 TaxID=3155158 RepID=UPI0033DFAF54